MTFAYPWGGLARAGLRPIDEHAAAHPPGGTSPPCPQAQEGTMSRRFAITVLAIYTLTLAAAAAGRATLDRVLASSRSASRVVGYGQIRYGGAGPELWALRFRRERRAVLTLRHQLAARLDRIVYLVTAFQCIHSYEGSWTANTGNGYRGGLQFGSREWRLYGGRYAASADQASPSEQIAAGITYHAVAGFYPWPNSARMCGLIR